MYLQVGFDEYAEADEFFTWDIVEVEHDELQHLEEFYLQ